MLQMFDVKLDIEWCVDGTQGVGEGVLPGFLLGLLKTKQNILAMRQETITKNDVLWGLLTPPQK